MRNVGCGGGTHFYFFGTFNVYSPFSLHKINKNSATRSRTWVAGVVNNRQRRCVMCSQLRDDFVRLSMVAIPPSADIAVAMNCTVRI